MRNHEMVMSLRESQRLGELEKVIGRGKKTFVEVGMALAEIRDLRLFKREYSSFSEYCQKKWGWNKSYAYYMIEGAIVVQALPQKVSTMVDTERQVRALTKVPAGQRAEVIQAIVDEGKPVTAAEIKKRIPPVPVRPSAPLAASPSPVVAPPPPPPVVDTTGWPVPTQLIPLWRRGDEAQELLTILSRVKGALRTAQDTRDKLFAEVNFSSALSQLDQAWADVKTAKPFAVCPSCQGQLPDHCTLCRGRGLISEHRWDTCVTREDKAFRAKVKSGRQPAGGESKLKC